MYQLGFLGQDTPKPRSTVYGPMPIPGTYPPYKGAKGPKQKKCLKAGGQWEGPTGQKWCQMPVSARPPGGELFFPPGTSPLGVPDFQAPIPPPIVTPPGGSYYQQPPSDTAEVPPGVQIPEPPIFDQPVDIPTDDAAVADVVADQYRQNGPAAMAAPGVVAPARGGLTAAHIIMIAAGAGLVWFVAKQAKKKKTTF